MTNMVLTPSNQFFMLQITSYDNKNRHKELSYENDERLYWIYSHMIFTNQVLQWSTKDCDFLFNIL